MHLRFMLLATALSVPGAAIAQERQGPAKAQDEDEEIVESRSLLSSTATDGIVVTARRDAGALTDTPRAVRG